MKDYVGIFWRHRHPLRFLTARTLTETGLCRLFKIVQNGYTLRYFPSNLSESLWIDPSFREPALDFFRSYLKLGDIVIDVGANIGDTVITSAIAVGHTGRVYAVEAHPRTFKFLTSNLALNRISNVTPINVALGDHEGTVSFGNGRRDDMNRVGEAGISIPVRPLDHVLPHLPEVALLKIDVEGYELPVIEGASRTLSSVDTVYLEASASMYGAYGYSIHDVLMRLKQAGFVAFIERPSALLPINVDTHFDTVENIIATRSVNRLRDRTHWSIL